MPDATSSTVTGNRTCFPFPSQSKKAIRIVSLKSLFSSLLGNSKDTSLSSAGRNTKPPIVIPIVIAKAGSKIETDLNIVEHNIYTFSLRFFFRGNDKEDRGRVLKLTGGSELDASGKPVEPGVPTPVYLKIYAVNPKSQQQQLIYAENLDPHMTKAADDHFKKGLADIELQPGHYRVSVETLQDAPEWAMFRIAFGIANDHYTSFTPPR